MFIIICSAYNNIDAILRFMLQLIYIIVRISKPLYAYEDKNYLLYRNSINIYFILFWQ